MAESRYHLLAVLFAACRLNALAPDTAATLREARLLLAKDEFTQALTLLSDPNRASLSSSEVTYLRGYTLYRLDRLPEAKKELRTAARLPPVSLQSEYVLARIAERENQRQEAIRWLERPARAEPPIEDAVTRIGKLFWDTGQFEKARLWTDKALAKTPWDGSLHYRLGRIYQQLGQEGPAKQELEESVKLKTADAEGVQELMECSRALAAHDAATAFHVRDHFLSLQNVDPDLLVALGTSFAAAGAPDQAIRLYQSAAAREPSFFQAHFDLGLALLNLNRSHEAIEPLQTSLRLVPESREANAAFALALVMEGNFKDAVVPLESARQADPQDRKTAGLLSLSYYRSGAASKAIPLLRESIDRSKDDPKVYFLLIDCLNATEQQQQALTVADEALKRFPTVGKAWLGKAQQLSRLGKYHEAGPLFAKAAELTPEQAEPLLGLAEAEQKDGNYQAALDTYQRAMAKSGGVTADVGAARSLIFLGRFPEARAILEQSRAINGSNSQVHFELSRVYARLGEKQLAQEETQIVQQLRAQENAADQSASAPR